MSRSVPRTSMAASSGQAPKPRSGAPRARACRYPEPFSEMSDSGHDWHGVHPGQPRSG